MSIHDTAWTFRRFKETLKKFSVPLHPRIHMLSELKELPVGTVVKNAETTEITQRFADGWYVPCSELNLSDDQLEIMLPVNVLWHPDWNEHV